MYSEWAILDGRGASNINNQCPLPMIILVSFSEASMSTCITRKRGVFIFLSGALQNLCMQHAQAFLHRALLQPQLSPTAPRQRGVLCDAVPYSVGTLSKTRRKGLKSKTTAVYVRYSSWSISSPSSAKQQCKMTRFCVFWRTWTTTANFLDFYLELNAFVACSAVASFNTD